MTHYRGVTIGWEADPGNPNQVTFEITGAWRVGAEDPIFFNFGDGTSAVLSPTILSSNAEFSTVRYTATHTYANAGDFEAFFESGNRISTLDDGLADAGFRSETIVNAGSANAAPVSSLPAIIQVADNQIFTLQIPAFDPDGNPLTYRFGNASEFISGFSSPATLIRPAGSTLSPTGLFTWDLRDGVAAGIDPGEQFVATFMVEDGFTKTPIDVILQVVQTGAGNNAPVFVNSPANPLTVAVGERFHLDLDADDLDGDNTIASIQALNAPANFSATFEQAGSELNISFEPDASQAGQTYVVNFLATDATGLTGQTSVTFTVPANQAPVAAADAYATDEDTALVVSAADGVLANDTDADAGDALAAVLVAGPQYGTLTLDADGSFRYRPDRNYNGADSFTYKANDGDADSDPVTVALTVNAVNDAPVVRRSALDSPLGNCDMGATIGRDDLAARDAEGDPLTYTLASLPATGTLLIGGLAARLGDSFTAEDIAAGRIQYLAGPVVPVQPVNTRNGPIDGAGVELSDFFEGFEFVVTDGQGGYGYGSFAMPWERYATVQTLPQWGGYWGGDGNDYQKGTGASNNMVGGGGCDLMLGGGGNDSMYGQDGDNKLFGEAGNDQLNAFGGDDLLDGGLGRDTLDAQGGDNWLSGGDGNDVLTAHDGDDTMLGGTGQDTIHANGGDNAIDAGAGNDTVTANEGDDTIIGGAGDDLIYANGGNNLFQLGGVASWRSDGNDTFYANGGADRYALLLQDRDGKAAGWGTDTIWSFRIAEGDQLVAFHGTAGFWDSAAKIAARVNNGAISGSRSADGGDLVLRFEAGAATSNLVLKHFFWNNADQLTPAEQAAGFGQAIGKTLLAGILDDAMMDGGVSGPSFFEDAQNYVTDAFML